MMRYSSKNWMSKFERHFLDVIPRKGKELTGGGPNVNWIP